MTSPALILHTSKYADDRLIAESFTEQAGPVSFIVRISHGGRRGNVPHTLFQPLALLDIEWDEHQRASLIKPRTARTLHIPHSIMASPVKASLAMFLAEFLRAVLRHEPTSPSVFNYCANAIKWLETVEDRPIANFHLAILVQMATLLGISPTPEELLPICPAQYHSFLPDIMRIDLSNQHLFQFSRTQRAEILRVILLYYRQHQTAFPEMKSVEVLTQIFD